MIIAAKYRLLVSRKAHLQLQVLLEEQRLLYNAALEERIDCYKKTGVTISKYDQYGGLSVCRKEIPGFSETALSIQRWTVSRLDTAFKGFFKRCLSTPHSVGFPRFRSKGRWRSFGFVDMDGCRLIQNRLKIKGIESSLKIHFHRSLPKHLVIKGGVVTKDSKGWSVSLLLKIAPSEQVLVNRRLGVDLGLRNFAYFSDGTSIPSPKFARNSMKLLRIKHRALSRCKKGSKRSEKVRRELSRVYEKVSNARRTWLHTQSSALVKRADLIAVEDLSVLQMVKHPKLSAAIYDASWSMFISMLAYKAEKAGKQLIKVDPRYTTQDCSSCGHREPKILGQRTHQCSICGLSLDRDHNAAINVLAAVTSRKERNVAPQGERALRNAIPNFRDCSLPQGG